MAVLIGLVLIPLTIFLVLRVRATCTLPPRFRSRGPAWLPETCQSCEDKEKDHGGCRCQAFMLTGDAGATDPVCPKSPDHALIEKALAEAERPTLVKPLVFRDPKNSVKLGRAF